MKKMSKLLALLLALVMVFCLAACGSDNKESKNNEDETKAHIEEPKGKSDEEKLVGQWALRFDLSDAMGAMFADAFGDDSFAPNTELYMYITLEFDDGEGMMGSVLDEDSLDDYMADLGDNLVDYLYDLAEENGKSREEFEAQVDADYGMTVEEYVEEEIALAIEAASEELTVEMSFCYEVDEDEGCIYIGEDEDELSSKQEAMIYSFSGSKLSITGFISEGEEIDDPFGLEAVGADMPWKFVKG